VLHLQGAIKNNCRCFSLIKIGCVILNYVAEPAAKQKGAAGQLSVNLKAEKHDYIAFRTSNRRFLNACRINLNVFGAI
jgi:hypothetical protein